MTCSRDSSTRHSPHGTRQLQLHAERVVGQPGAVRQRVADRRLVQSRFRWILQPGNDLFLVLNRGWFRTFDGGRIRAALQSRIGEATIHVQILMTAFRIGFAAWALLTATLFAGREPTAPIGQTGTPSAPGTSAAYVGSTACARCHAPIYDRWKRTRMANVVRDPKDHPDAIIPDLSRPDPLVTFTRDDIAFTYGSKWKQRYFTKVGDDYFPLPAQWDVTHRQWRPYNVAIGTDWWTAFYPPENSRRPTGPLCDGCHSVNYNVRTKTRHRVECRLREMPRARKRPRRAAGSRNDRQPGAARSDRRRRRLPPVPLAGQAARQPGRRALLRLAGRVPRRPEPERLLAARGAQARRDDVHAFPGRHGAQEPDAGQRLRAERDVHARRHLRELPRCPRHRAQRRSGQVGRGCCA